MWLVENVCFFFVFFCISCLVDWLYVCVRCLVVCVRLCVRCLLLSFVGVCGVWLAASTCVCVCGCVCLCHVFSCEYACAFLGVLVCLVDRV